MNQKDLIKYGLLALGAYLVWKYIEDHGGISAVLGTSTGAGATAQTPAQIAAAAAASKAASDLAAANAAHNAAAIAAAQKAASDAAAAKAAADAAAAAKQPPNAPAIGTIYTDAAGNKQQWNGTGWTLITAPVDPVPPPTPPVTISKMEQIQSLATQSGQGPLLTADQWRYYAAQLGINTPDPGSIDPALYDGAWGPGTDRTTPIAIDTFWYLSTTTDPSLSGLGAFGLMGMSGLGAVRAPWLM